jgi:predicted RecB family endonuclease
LSRQERTLARDDWRLAATKGILGASLVRRRDYRTAEPLLLEANDVLKEVAGRQGREAAAVHDALAALYQALDRPDRAAGYRRTVQSPPLH